MSTTETKYAYEKEGTFSERFPILYDKDQRYQKAAKVIAVCRDYADKPLSELVALDLGASTSIMTDYFAQHFKQVVCIRARMPPMPTTSCTCVPMAPARHWPTVRSMSSSAIRCMNMSRINRGWLSKSNGCSHLTVSAMLIEGHYFLPCLSWMPMWMSHLYLKMMGRKVKYDVYLLSLRRLRKLLKNFEMIDYTERLIRDPERFAATDVIRPRSWLARLPRRMFRLIYPIRFFRVLTQQTVDNQFDGVILR